MLGLSGTGNWVTFVMYMVFCVNHGILVTWTQDKEKGYSYNATAAVLHAEVLKLLVASLMAIRSKSLSAIVQEMLKNKKVLALYFIPALLYAMYNSLSFLNLTHFDPTSYYILMQFKVVVSGVIYQVLFRKSLSGKQWFSLVLLTLGCMVQQIKPDKISSLYSNEPEDEPDNGCMNLTGCLASIIMNPGLLFIFFQICCSSIAGVYTELLLKRHSNDLDLWVQNIFMYTDSIVCGLLIFSASGQPVEKLFLLLPMEDSLPASYRWKILAVVSNMAAMGIVTSIFLKSLNSIVKNFATALEVIITAILSWILFGMQINLSTFFAVVVILTSIYVYSNNPLVRHPIASAPRKAKFSESEKDEMNANI